MTLKDYLDSDLDIFFDTENFFAESITYTPKDDSPVETQALMDFKENLAEDSRGSHIMGRAVVKIAETGLPKNGDEILYNGVTYKVIRILDRDDLIARVFIRADLRGKFRK